MRYFATYAVAFFSPEAEKAPDAPVAPVEQADSTAVDVERLRTTVSTRDLGRGMELSPWEGRSGELYR
jgi:hypothetical protein